MSADLIDLFDLKAQRAIRYDGGADLPYGWDDLPPNYFYFKKDSRGPVEQISNDNIAEDRMFGQIAMVAAQDGTLAQRHAHLSYQMSVRYGGCSTAEAREAFDEICKVMDAAASWEAHRTDRIEKALQR